MPQSEEDQSPQALRSEVARMRAALEAHRAALKACSASFGRREGVLARTMEEEMEILGKELVVLAPQ